MFILHSVTSQHEQFPSESQYFYLMHDSFYPQVKGLSSQEFAARNDLALTLPDRIQAIPDGSPAVPKQTGGWAASASRPEIKFDSGN